MSRRTTLLLYLGIIGLIVVPIAVLLHLGADLPAPAGPAAAVAHAVPAADAGTWTGLARNLEHPLSRLFLQLLVIIVAARIAGSAFAALGQPAVVGEMAAGILVGPSLFGLVAPDAFAFVFPPASLETLKLLSQIGVCLFMFVVGMELDVQHVRTRAHTAVLVSHVSIVFPYLLGVALAFFLYTDLAAPGASFTSFALFMGIALSITAFPVLARILQERGLTRTVLGSAAITCAAVDDVTAWSILAFVVAISRATSVGGAAFGLLLAVAFLGVMLLGVRRALPRWLGVERLAADEPSAATLAVVVCVLLAAALGTEVIGIHALFGAFLAGVVMPETDGFRQKLALRIRDFSAVLLLPLFFAFTGLRTQIGLLDDLQGWLVCAAIVAVATVGKLGGSAVAARLTGMGWSDALQLGALMNTRGLMELIALNIGYDLGILSPRIFTMLVVMALATTLLTGPLLTLFREKESALDSLPAPS